MISFLKVSIASVLVDIDEDKRQQALIDFSAVDLHRVFLDHLRLFQFPYALGDRRNRKADLFADFGGGCAGRCLLIRRVWHNQSNPYETPPFNLFY